MKHIRRASAGICVLLAAISVAAQVRINYQDQDFALSGFDTFSATLEDRGISFEGDGKPLKIDVRSSGTTLSGSSAKGSAERGRDRNYFLKDVSITGGSHLILDGEAAFTYQKSHGETPAPSTLTKTDIQSDSLRYAGTASEGRIEFPGSTTIDSTSRVRSATDGKEMQRAIKVSGTSGFVMMSLAAGGNNSLKSGELKGPVNFSGSSEAPDVGGQVETTTFQGKADNLKFDFSAEPRTMTLSGNVTMNSRGVAAAGEISADSVVVTVDANLKPVKIDITGSPAKTTLREQPPIIPARGAVRQ